MKVTTNEDQTGPRVSIDQGTVEGVQENGTQAFRGIRYAPAPAGDLR